MENSFGKNLGYFRKNAGFTQKEFAEKLNIPLATLAGYETSSREPKFDTVIKISEILNISIDELFTGNTGNTKIKSLEKPVKKRFRIVFDSDENEFENKINRAVEKTNCLDVKFSTSEVDGKILFSALLIFGEYEF